MITDAARPDHFSYLLFGPVGLSEKLDRLVRVPLPHLDPVSLTGVGGRR